MKVKTGIKAGGVCVPCVPCEPIGDEHKYQGTK